MGGPTASNFTLPHWHIAKRCLCCFWFTAPSHSWVPFIRRSSIGSAKRPQRVCAVARLRFPVGASPAGERSSRKQPEQLWRRAGRLADLRDRRARALHHMFPATETIDWWVALLSAAGPGYHA